MKEKYVLTIKDRFLAMCDGNLRDCKPTIGGDDYSCEYFDTLKEACDKVAELEDVLGRPMKTNPVALGVGENGEKHAFDVEIYYIIDSVTIERKHVPDFDEPSDLPF